MENHPERFTALVLAGRRGASDEFADALTEADAAAGEFVALSSSAMFGTSHSIGAVFRTAPTVAKNTITLDTPHGMDEGTALVYDNGFSPVGGLTDGGSYYIKYIDAGTIQLAKLPSI